MHQVTLVSVALLCGAVWSTVFAQDPSFEIGGNTISVVFRPRKFNKAQKYCRDNLGGNLAQIEDEAQLAQISDSLKAIFEERGEELTALRTGERTDKQKKKEVSFSDIDDSGKRCVYVSWWEKRTKECKKGRKGRKCRRKNKGGQTADTAKLFSHKCGKKRYFLCATPIEGPPPPPPPPEPEVITPTTSDGTAQTFTALGREYTVDFAHNYQSQFDAIEFCQANGKRLAEIRDQATLDGVGAALLSIQQQTGMDIGEIVTAERSSQAVNADVTFDKLNPSGWACGTLIDNDGTVALTAQRCAVERGVLCEEIPSC